MTRSPKRCPHRRPFETSAGGHRVLMLEVISPMQLAPTDQHSSTNARGSDSRGTARVRRTCSPLSRSHGCLLGLGRDHSRWASAARPTHRQHPIP